MTLPEFIRLFTIRGPHLMWFLGAGTSASAGIPSAFDLLWEFKRILYCTSQKISVRAVENLGDPSVRRRLQYHIDSLRTYPKENADDEYAAFFEAVYPGEVDRRRYIERIIEGRSPAFGHEALAALVTLGKMQVMATTNFDRLVEDALTKQLGSTGAFTVATIDNASIGLQALNERRRPLYLKLHGDFQSRRLKNISSELRAQDEELRKALVEGCRRYGLVVIGYSGRDRSIMDAMEEAIDQGKGYPNGLFWFYRRGVGRLASVDRLIERSRNAGVEVAEIEVETFDELMADILDVEHKLPPRVLELMDRRARLAKDSPIPEPSTTGWPIVRLNAVPVLRSPTLLRKVVCQIGGTEEVREAVRQSGAKVLASRARVGVLAIGRDEEVRRCFAPFDVAEFDLHTVEPVRLERESSEKGLLLEALAHAICRSRPLEQAPGRQRFVLIPSTDGLGPWFELLKKSAEGLGGTVPRTTIRWSEALRIRLDFRLGRLWVLLRPSIWIDEPQGASTDKEELEASEAAREFRRKRLVKRWNKKAYEILDAWISILFEGATEVEFRTWDITDGIDSVFQLSKKTAYSRPGSSR